MMSRGPSIGVDPGMSGAVALIVPGEKGYLKVWRDFKCHQNITAAIVAALGEASHAPFPAELVCAVEMVHAMPGQGVTSMFHFGESTGVALGAILAGGKTPLRPRPQVWQHWVKQTVVLNSRMANSVKPSKTLGPFDARHYAATLYPDYVDLFHRVLDHNTADSVLLARWAIAHPL